MLMLFFFLICMLGSTAVSSQTRSPASALRIARLKYDGGGDWYNDPSIIPNLLKYISDKTNMDVADTEDIVEINDESLFAHPILFMTGHGKKKRANIELINRWRYSLLIRC